MPPKSGVTEAELKVRIPRTLMERVNAYRHRHQHENRKDAVIELLLLALDSADASEAQNGKKID